MITRQRRRRPMTKRFAGELEYAAASGKETKTLSLVPKNARERRTSRDRDRAGSRRNHRLFSITLPESFENAGSHFYKRETSIVPNTKKASAPLNELALKRFRTFLQNAATKIKKSGKQVVTITRKGVQLTEGRKRTRRSGNSLVHGTDY